MKDEFSLFNPFFNELLLSFMRNTFVEMMFGDVDDNFPKSLYKYGLPPVSVQCSLQERFAFSNYGIKYT